MRDNVAEHLRLMLVTDDVLMEGRDLLQLALAAERGGISSLQLRLKQRPARDLVKLVRILAQALTVPVLVNDRPDVALAAGAAGVHLGPEDIPVDLTRHIAPPGFIVGASVGSAAEADAARAALGAGGFRELVELAGGRPCVAIGGVRPEDVPAVLAAGGSGVAVVSGILGAEDVEAAARAYAVGQRGRGAAGQ